MIKEINLFEKLEQNGEDVVEFSIFWQQAQRVSRFNHQRPYEKVISNEVWLIGKVDLNTGMAEAKKS